MQLVFVRLSSSQHTSHNYRFNNLNWRGRCNVIENRRNRQFTFIQPRPIDDSGAEISMKVSSLAEPITPLPVKDEYLANVLRCAYNPTRCLLDLTRRISVTEILLKCTSYRHVWIIFSNREWYFENYYVR